MSDNRGGAAGVIGVLSSVLEKCINACVCVLLSVIVIAISIQVFGREVNIPVVWLGELCTYSTIWLVFFGLAIGYRHGLFAQVDVICHLVPKGWNKYLSIFWDVAGLVIMGIIVWSSRDYIAHVARSGTLSSELRLPLYIVYMGPILGYLFTGFFTIENLIRKVGALRPREADTAANAEGGN